MGRPEESRVRLAQRVAVLQIGLSICSGQDPAQYRLQYQGGSKCETKLRILIDQIALILENEVEEATMNMKLATGIAVTVLGFATATVQAAQAQLQVPGAVFNIYIYPPGGASNPSNPANPSNPGDPDNPLGIGGMYHYVLPENCLLPQDNPGTWCCFGVYNYGQPRQENPNRLNPDGTHRLVAANPCNIYPS